MNTCKCIYVATIEEIEALHLSKIKENCMGRVVGKKGEGEKDENYYNFKSEKVKVKLRC